MLRFLCACVAAARALAPPRRVSLGDYVIQRGVQQQLYYSADLRNEIQVNWLKSFRGHEHLDSRARRSGQAGFPGTYNMAFSLLTTPYAEYLSAMGEAPDEIIEVELATPRKRLSARERANPFLAKQAAEIYEEVMKPPAFLSKLLKTTDVLVQTWAFHLEQVEGSDLERVAMDREPSVKLPSPEMMRDAELAAGGETIYSRYTEDEPMPLYAFDRRACDRLATIRALGQLVEEVQALTPQTALECDFLRREAKADDDDENVDERIAERRRIRREKREAAYVGGDELAKAGAARDAALTFLEQFGNKWIPKLLKGDERSDLQLAACRKPGMPMQMLNRPPAAGADADAVLEDLWSYRNESPLRIVGGELVVPAKMGVRLRELRSAAAAEMRREIKDEIYAEINAARAKYTNDPQPVWSTVTTNDDKEFNREEIFREMNYN
mmetsp:Transcript_22597/g.70846  ORF Transcript_22597/g.70846 Transcript_22597/m.70846 type:complete len:440 (-) Transcript_22597:48-1367(-)